MKYTFEMKLSAVKFYESNGGFKYPKSCKNKSKKKTYSNKVKFWYSVYQLNGEEGLKRKENNDTYTPERKFSLIAPILSGLISCTKQPKTVGIESGTLSSWINRYRKDGIDGLKCSRRGRPRKTMPIENPSEIKQVDSTDDKKRIEELEYRVILLEAENEY